MTPAEAIDAAAAFAGYYLGAFIKRALFTVDGWWMIPLAFFAFCVVGTMFNAWLEWLGRTPEERKKRREYMRTL